MFKIKHGFAFKSEHFSSEGEFVLLTPGNFHEKGGFRRRLGKDRYFTGDIPEAFVLNAGDLIIAMTEQGPGLLGSSALIPDTEVFLHNQRIGLIHSVDEAKLDLKFLFYLFNTTPIRGQINASATGTKVRHTAPERIYRISTAVPDLADQKRIADTLSAYDDLIENNRRRIALLEDAARQLYKEWFVRFRFPGHEHVAMNDGVPQGWERAPASSVLNILSGGTPKTTTSQFWDGDIGFFTPKDAVQGAYVSTTEKTITEEGLAKCNSKLYPRDTLFITARGTVGKMNLALVPMAMNQSCYALVSKSCLSQRMLYLTMDASLQQFRSQASGAVFDAIVVATFDRISVIKPDAKIAEAFDEVINPVFDQIANLGRQNEHLAKARDLLLPKLMNGSLIV
jgi:type I restriction enzyme S subunit